MTYKEIQEALAKAGFYTGKIDGLFGPKSKAALMACIQKGTDPDLAEERVKSAVNAAVDFISKALKEA